ncbi:ran-specific GTPase-activating protein [Cephus cinctus]|uniref:Ran-specific GTPase-activating protein n=1 Tax=Cephus cinctus TaxID=211228 RepID=A0AAJ7BSN5_CEPCN|nr:ran-specific GTPase-activating protein [Cephus cinctus]
MPENVLNGDHVDVNGANGEPREHEEEATEEDVHFEPIITLPLIEVSNNEEEEVELIKLRAKLYRYDSSSDPAEWKERGTGDVKLLRHKIKNTVRVVMRRDKTLKICANHFITPWMELKPNCGSDRAWVWSVLADYADEQLKQELLAIRFANAENASMWKEAFEKAKKIVGAECEIYAGKTNPEEAKDDSDSDSDSSSDVSYGESSDNDERNNSTKPKEDTSPVQDSSATKDYPKDLTAISEKDTKKTDELTEKLEHLNVKADGQSN